MKSGNQTDVTFLYNATLEKEVKSVDNSVEISLSHNNGDDSTTDTCSSISDRLYVLFYTYIPTNSRDICLDVDTRKCALSSRCIHTSLLEYLETYNICQDNSFDDDDSSKSVSEEETSYMGVAVFASTLAMLFIILILMQMCHSKSVVHVCRMLFCLANHDEEGGLTFHQEGQGAPDFTLDAPPPSYSDLSSIDGYQNQTLDEDVSDVPQQPGQQSDGNTEGGIHISVPRTLSADRLSSTLPPSYSDVIIHQEKYHVHY